MKVENSRQAGESISNLSAEYKSFQGGGEVRNIKLWCVYLVNGQTFQTFKGSRWSIFADLF